MKVHGWHIDGFGVHHDVHVDDLPDGLTIVTGPNNANYALLYLAANDAAKNRAELVSGDTDMTYDAAVSRASIAAIWELWRRKPGSIVVPGHDVPMVQEEGVSRYLGPREAAIKSWFGDGMDETTLFSLT